MVIFIYFKTLTFVNNNVVEKSQSKNDFMHQLQMLVQHFYAYQFVLLSMYRTYFSQLSYIVKCMSKWATQFQIESKTNLPWLPEGSAWRLNTSVNRWGEVSHLFFLATSTHWSLTCAWLSPSTWALLLSHQLLPQDNGCQNTQLPCLLCHMWHLWHHLHPWHHHQNFHFCHQCLFFHLLNKRQFTKKQNKPIDINKILN